MENILFKQIKKLNYNNKTFINFISFKYTYKQLYDDILRMTALFEKYQLDENAYILIISNSQKDSISIFLSALCNQICTVLLPTDINSIRLKQILKDVKPDLIFVDSDLSVQYESQKIIRIDNDNKKSNLFKKLFNKHDSNKFPSILTNYEAKKPVMNINDNNNAYIIYTSGTTTSPKGVVHTHKSYLSHLQTLIKVYSYTNKSIIFNNLDLSHADGMFHGPVLSAIVGATLVRPDKFSLQNLNDNLNMMYRYNVSHFICPPIILDWINKYIDDVNIFDKNCLKYIISVSAKLSKNLWDNLEEKFDIRIYDMYGLTETVSGAVFGEANKKAKAIDIKAALLCNGKILPYGNGELILKGDSVFKEYFKNAESTEKAFIDGWFKTGDIANIDKEGYIEIVGRLKNIIICNGRNITPEEIDEVLLRNKGIKE
ncbi:long-chain-fatty-acid--CoA ligase [Francisella sp. W12-1067]|nr:long-chain-fatty-acid--CoA ligase [Francisella sp. W12-1067]